MTFRNRYRVGGKDWADKPRRWAVVPVQQLRASVGMFLDWFRICLMHGFLASARHTQSFECKTRSSGRGHWTQVVERRDDTGLWLPYGKKAHVLGLAPDDTIPNQRAGP